jgi:hypothetical protein
MANDKKKIQRSAAQRSIIFLRSRRAREARDIRLLQHGQQS